MEDDDGGRKEGRMKTREREEQVKAALGRTFQGKGVTTLITR